MEQNVPLLSLSVMKIPFRRMERRILPALRGIAMTNDTKD